eukprot:1299104-Amorphochlora_amoeboformis.AAC.2
MSQEFIGFNFVGLKKARSMGDAPVGVVPHTAVAYWSCLVNFEVNFDQVPKVVVHDKTLRAILFDVGVLVTGLAGMYIGLKYIVNNMDPTKDRKKDRKVPVQVLKRLKQNGFNAEMGDYEATMLQHITFPGEVSILPKTEGECLFQPVFSSFFGLPTSMAWEYDIKAFDTLYQFPA